MIYWKIFLTCGGWMTLAAAQLSNSYCDPQSQICFQGFIDNTLGVTVGFVLPPASSPPSDEYIVQIVAPSTYGWTGVSVGGSMTMGLLLTMWPFDGQIILGSRWTSTVTLPQPYFGPRLTLLPNSGNNGTHVTANIRCQNCTIWQGGSFGSGNLDGFQFIAYVISNTEPVEPSSNTSILQMHGASNFSPSPCISSSSASPTVSSSTSPTTILSSSVISAPASSFTISTSSSNTSTPPIPLSTSSAPSTSSVPPSTSSTPSSASISFTFISSSDSSTPLSTSTSSTSSIPSSTSFIPSSSSMSSTFISSSTSIFSPTSSPPSPPVTVSTTNSTISKPPSTSSSAPTPASSGTVTSTIPPPPPPPSNLPFNCTLSSTGLPEWCQCGGIGWTGETRCVPGSECAVDNPYYSQCLPTNLTTSASLHPSTPATSRSSPSTALPSTSTFSPSIPTVTTTLSPTSSSSRPSSSSISASSHPVITPPTATTSAAGAGQSAFGQCGGIGWTGTTICVAGTTCAISNPFFSQCLPA